MHIGGQVLHVGQAQHARLRGHVEVGAVRRQRLRRPSARRTRAPRGPCPSPACRGACRIDESSRRRATVPARTRDVTGRRCDAPAVPGSRRSGRATLNVQHSGTRSAIRPSRAAVSSGAGRSATRSRARTTLSSSPALIRPIASDTARAQCSTGRVPGAQRIGPDATCGSGSPGATGATPSHSDGGQPCPPAPVTDHDGRHDHDGLLRPRVERERRERHRDRIRGRPPGPRRVPRRTTRSTSAGPG